MSCHTCLDPIPDACVSLSNSPDETVADFIRVTNDKLDSLLANQDTTGLIGRTFSQTDIRDLTSFLQALIDRIVIQDTRLVVLEAKEVPQTLLDTPVPVINQCGVLAGLDPAPQLDTLLNTLLCQIVSLKADVAALKAGQPTGTQLYVPHY